MRFNSRREREQYQMALGRFYALVITVLVLVVVAFVMFFNIPALQDPSTGTLPDAGGRALAFFGILFLVSSAGVLYFYEGRRK